MVKIKKRITAAGLLQAIEIVSLAEIDEAEKRFGPASQAVQDWHHIFAMVHAFLEVNELSFHPCQNNRASHHEKMYNNMVLDCEKIFKFVGKQV